MKYLIQIKSKRITRHIFDFKNLTDKQKNGQI